MLTTISDPAFGLNPVLLRKMQVSFILTRSVHLGYDCVLEQVHGKKKCSWQQWKSCKPAQLLATAGRCYIVAVSHIKEAAWPRIITNLWNWGKKISYTSWRHMLIKKDSHYSKTLARFKPLSLSISTDLIIVWKELKLLMVKQ